MAYYVLNTNKSNSEEDDKYMLQEQKAAAFFTPWKQNIEKFQKGDVVFLYRSGEGIIAVGTASGEVVKRDYQNNSEHPEEEYCQYLADFKHIGQPLNATKIKAITGTNHVFHKVMFSLDDDAGRKLYGHMTGIAG